MAPALFEKAQGLADGLMKRQYSNDYYCSRGYSGYCYSSWSSWGRWVALVGIVLFVVFIALLFSCFNARRRRRRGVQPVYGTGWLAGKTPDGHNGPSYTGYNNQQQYVNPAPPYSQQHQQPQYTGNTFNSNEGYYGQQNGIELQQPQQAYGGQNVYAAPSGPPPGKDGIVR